MKHKKKICLILAIVMLSGIAAGCGVLRVDEEKDRQRVVAEVNGEEILKGEFLDIYDAYKEYFGITEETENDREFKEVIEELKNDIINMLIDQKIIDQKLDELGYEVTDEMRDEAVEYLESYIQNIADNNKYMDEEAGNEILSDEEYLEEAREAVYADLEANGTTYDEFIEGFAREEAKNRMFDDVIGDITPDEGAIREYYEKELANQKEQPMDPGMMALYGLPVFYEMEQKRVKHILIGFSEEDRAEISTLRQNQQNEEADALRDEKHHEVRSRAQEVLDLVRAGEDFEALIEEYNTDPGMEGNPEGYYVSSISNHVAEFKDASLALSEEGEVTGLVGTDFGYHIIKLYEDIPEKIYTLEETREEIVEILEQELEQARLQEIIDEWKESAQIKIYENRL